MREIWRCHIGDSQKRTKSILKRQSTGSFNQKRISDGEGVFGKGGDFSENKI